MSVKYYCDVCGKEERRKVDLIEVSIDHHSKTGVVKFDLCQNCLNKMIKPVQELHGEMIVEMPKSKK